MLSSLSCCRASIASPNRGLEGASLLRRSNRVFQDLETAELISAPFFALRMISSARTVVEAEIRSMASCIREISGLIWDSKISSCFLRFSLRSCRRSCSASFLICRSCICSISLLAWALWAAASAVMAWTSASRSLSTLWRIAAGRDLEMISISIRISSWISPLVGKRWSK